MSPRPDSLSPSRCGGTIGRARAPPSSWTSTRSRVAETLHFGGAFVVHLCTGLTALAAFLLARRRRVSWWPTGIAVAVFVVSFAQAAFGDYGVLSVHVPLAMLLLVGSVVVMAWSFARPQI